VNWRRFFLWALVLGGVVVGACLALRQPQPEYRGRSLSQWLTRYGRSGDDELRRREAADAVRQIGTNAIPYLVENIRYETPEWMCKVARATERLPGPLYGLVGIGYRGSASRTASLEWLLYTRAGGGTGSADADQLDGRQIY
jgi:hypothetical protein